ncbi:extracellular solute-binding protein [Hyphobacterium sp.]|uniref:extracellular solute-binding protein n=1 Tax=Hyphobacterium sp. TaxID=2004662 RepID=UPI003BA89D84
MLRRLLPAALGLALAACSQPASDSDTADQTAGSQSLNVYSSRHYESDRVVYAAFTEETGIEINLIEAGGDLLIERIRADGERSPADIVITVDANRLHRAEAAGLFAQEDYSDIATGVPGTFIDPDGHWLGFALRARVIAYANDRVDPAEIGDYLDLADPRWQNRICVRSSTNVYNESLTAALIAHHGEQAAEAWVRSIDANLARNPQGGDTDQLRAIHAGECDVAMVNHYYYVRLANSDDANDTAVSDGIGLIFPEGEHGTHVNISGVGIAANAPNAANAETFIRFLLSEQGQRAYAELTNEIPAVEGAAFENPRLRAVMDFQADTLNLSELGDNSEAARRILDRSGWP